MLGYVTLFRSSHALSCSQSPTFPQARQPPRASVWPWAA